jgi:DNA polymerase III subunit gamma/tau
MSGLRKKHVDEAKRRRSSMSEEFYDKFRPSQLKTVVGQEVVVKSLTKAALKERFHHAYLLAGPKGTGKTTFARIIAALATCPDRQPNTDTSCGKCRSCRAIHEGSCIDVSEIDAATEGGVEEVRDLKKSASYAPNTLKKKIYIIDEAHMLSIQANNALLKIVEEPPPYVMFILCTTDPHKLVDTLVSRCQRHNLKRVDAGQVAARLEVVSGHEKIKLGPGAALKIAKMAKGSMRDAYGILEQISMFMDNDVTVEGINAYYGQPDGRLVYSVARMVFEKNVSGVMKVTDECYSANINPRVVLMEFSNVLNDVLHIKTCGANTTLVQADEPERKLLCWLADKVPLKALLRMVGSLNRVEGDLAVNLNERLVLDAALVNCILIISSEEKQDSNGVPAVPSPAASEAH